MDAHLISVMQECTSASDDGRISFPDVLSKMMEAGIERYHCDLIRSEKTYYMPDGRTHTTPAERHHGPAAMVFSPSDIENAIRASQSGRIDYRTFCRLVSDAGCVGYHVSLPGMRAVYYGRTGETHVEKFPGS